MDDRDFFSKVFLEMKGMLTGYFLSNKVRFQDVEDVVNEVFFLAWRYKNTLRDKLKVRSWIFSIAKNVLKVYKNNIKKHKSRFSEVDGDLFYSNNPNDEDLSFVLELIEKLPDKYRDVFVLFYIEDKSVKEISEILNISESNCKIRLMRAREKLRSMLENNDLSNG